MNLVFDNIIFSLQKNGGISVVWQNLLQQLRSANINFKCIEYIGAQQNLSRKNLQLEATATIQRALYSLLIQQFISPNFKSDEPFVFHSSFFRICRNKLAKNVTTVHDFIYERQTSMTLSQRVRSNLNHKAILKSDCIVCVSENTRNDLFRFIPGIDRKKVFVIQNGVSDDYHVITEAKKDSKLNEYILFVGGRQGYKNFQFAVEAIAQSPFKMLICGAPLNKVELDLLNRKLGTNRYCAKNLPSNAELNIYYNSVHALLYPSSYEGFGIPVIEAQKAGCPVIAMNASSIPEIAGDAALLMPSDSISAFNDAVSQLDISQRRDNLISNGILNSKKYTWEQMAQSYYKLYQHITN